MKFGLSLLLALWALFSFSACTGMLESLRAESREADEEAERDRQEDELAGGYYKPKTLSGLSANNVSEFQPPATRAYGARAVGRATAAADAAGDMYDSGSRRVTRDDFVDRAARENSLWDAQGQSNYLFANNRRRESGDMITADVEKELRREIQYQLWLTLPPEQRKVRKPASASATDALKNTAASAAKDGTADPKAAAEKSIEAKAKDAAEEAAKTNISPAGKEDDTIRMEVVENMGNGLVRVLGQKRVIYKGVSRIVEVAALVNNKDVDDANHTKSSAFLDTKAQVIQ